MPALKRLESLIILDEVQRLPEIYPVLRVLIDNQKFGRRFLIRISVSPALLQELLNCWQEGSNIIGLRGNVM